jgi:hypothetical protein
MPCCGEMRQPAAGPMIPSRGDGRGVNTGRGDLFFEIKFEYTGQTALTVVGPVSGRRYRFGQPGSRLVVDPRDRPGLAMNPKLRQRN